MKTKLQILISIMLFSLCSVPTKALTDYCGEEVNLSYGGQTKKWTLKCWKEGTTYKMEVICIDVSITSVNTSQYGNLNNTWSSLDAYLSVSNGVLYGNFPSEPSGSGGSSLNISLNSGTLNFPLPTDINWDATCATIPATNVVYFVNSWGWSEPEAHYWGGTSGNEWTTLTATDMTTCSGAPVFTIDCGDNTKVVFREKNNDSKKTQDLDLYAGRFYNPHPDDSYTQDEWYYSNNFVLKGTFDSWAEHKFSNWTGSGSTIVTTTVNNLAANTTYEFYIQQTDANRYYKNTGTMTKNNSTCWFMPAYEGGDNAKITTKAAGNYTFNYDFAANRLSVVYPAEIGCTGHGQASSCPVVYYEIVYDGSATNIKAWVERPTTFTSCELRYGTNTSAQPTVLQGTKLDDNIYMFSVPTTGANSVAANATMYFFFQYQAGSMGSAQGTASSLSDGNRFEYKVGNCSLDDDVPYMKSAIVSAKTSTSITLDLNAIVNKGNNTVTDFKINGTTYTATNGKVTFSNLTPNTQYTYTVYAVYSGYVSQNNIVVDAKTNKISECEGTRGHYATTAETAKIDFKINYDYTSKNITMTFSDHDGGQLDFVQVEWNVPGVSSGTANTGNNVTLSAGVATYTLTATDNMIGKAMGIQVVYSNTNMAGNLQISDNNNPDTGNGVIYYVVGECSCAADDGDNPVMGTVTVAAKTSTSVTLNVSATDEHSTVSTYVIDGKRYTAFGGQITVDGLSMCTNYTLDVYAEDPSCNRSEQPATISFKTLFDSNYDLLQSATAEFGYEGNVGHKGEKCIDGDFTTRGGTQNGTLEQSWLTIDLGSIQSFNRIDIYWEAAIPGDAGYDIEFSLDGTHYAQVGHYPKPTKTVQDPNTPTKGNTDHLTRHDLQKAIQGRYIRIKALDLLNNDWGISIWEVEVYNNGAEECPEEPECPQIINAYVQSTTPTTATLYMSVIDMQTTDPDDLEYKIRVVCSPDKLNFSNLYTFKKGEHRDGIINIEGLVPGAPYKAVVQVLDGDEPHDPPCDSVTLTFTTTNGSSCATVIEGNSVRPESNALPDGLIYTYTLTPVHDNVNNKDGFTVQVNFNQDVNEVFFAQNFDGTQPNDCYTGWVEFGLTRENARKFTGTYYQDSTYTRQKYGCDNDGTGTTHKPLFPFWPNIYASLKIVTEGSGVSHIPSYPFNPTEDCTTRFSIYHHDDTPANDSRTTYDGGTIATDIYYYRHLTGGVWETLYLPFDVDKVQVYNSSSKKYYDLKAQTSSKSGQYWLRQQQTEVSGADFKESWYDDTNSEQVLPKKNTPYIIRVPSGTYYNNKFIVFHAAANQTIPETFKKGDAPTSTDRYTYYGNNTLKEQSSMKAYWLSADGTLFEQSTSTLYPFECYVLANATTMGVMRVIGRWTGTQTPTDTESVFQETDIYPQMDVYTVLGQRVCSFSNICVYDVLEQIYANLPRGCYLLCADGKTEKVILP